jgi:hypothetical protein
MDMWRVHSTEYGRGNVQSYGTMEEAFQVANALRRKNAESIYVVGPDGKPYGEEHIAEWALAHPLQ